MKPNGYKVNPMGISNPMGIGRTYPMGAEIACQWVKSRGGDNVSFRAGKAKNKHICFLHIY